MDFQDCKVRVSNVDSQASHDNIVIQVIGETSNKSAELKKFVQTFVLAQQPTGYFVLNDIFRYINEEGEEEAVENTQEEPAAGPLVEDVEMPKAQAAVEEPAAALDAEVVDKKLEEVAEPEPVEEAPATNGTPAPEAEETPAASEKAEEVPTPEAAAQEVEEEEIKEPEKPKDPVPTPIISRAPSTTAKPAAPAQPTGPPKPLSWASRAAAAVGSAPKPAVPVVAPKTSTPPAQARAAPPAAKPAQAQAPTSASAPTPSAEKEKENGANAGWQSVGDHTKRQNRPQSISAGAPEKDPGTMGYVRNVTEKVGTEELKAALGSFGQLIYFDVNRGKVLLTSQSNRLSTNCFQNCAFVEYANAEGYQAAAAANPHQVSGEAIYVEPRRPKAGAYGGNGYAGGRGGLNQRGRGQFQNRGRGGGGAPRGRGTPAATTA